MPSTALARLESLLSNRQLDHTLPSRRPGAWDDRGAPTGLGMPEEDLLAGELPRGQVSEIIGARSSGRQTVLSRWLAAATARGELTALVDPLDMFDPPSAAARGVDLSRLLWVRGQALGADPISLPRECDDLRVQVDRAVKAVNLILQAGGFGVVGLDLGEVPALVLRRLPFTTWRRLYRVIEGGDTACVVVAGESLARSVAGITLTLQAAAGDRASITWPRHVATFPSLVIEGSVIHSRGMRTDRFRLADSFVATGEQIGSGRRAPGYGFSQARSP